MNQSSPGNKQKEKNLKAFTCNVNKQNFQELSVRARVKWLSKINHFFLKMIFLKIILT